jgi:ADP-ribosylglycohydrolase
MPQPTRYTGCLLGGAVGDALGAPVEFDSLATIRARTGPAGVREYAPAYGRVGAITDDTQMTLFTAEGLLRAGGARGERPDRAAVVSSVHRSYLRWFLTQGMSPPGGVDAAALRTGWLFSLSSLHSARAPGNTCLGALRTGRAGAVDAPLNRSKGCGGVMRAAPVGLLGHHNTLGLGVFRLGCDVAALTHGHPSGYLAAGVLAHLVASLRDGATLPEAIPAALAVLREFAGHEECLAAVQAAVDLAASGVPSAERVERLGGGWVGEEALAIGLYCALAAPALGDALPLAVTHSGDGDSTGAIAGNLLGVLLGEGAIPARWLAPLELQDEIRTVAEDLYERFGAEPDASAAAAAAADAVARYPCEEA